MPEAAAITIGNFDGVHLGHVQLVHAAATDRRTGWSRHRDVVRSTPPYRPAPERRTEIDHGEAADLFDSRRADQVDIIRPSEDFLRQTPEQFVEWLLHGTNPHSLSKAALSGSAGHERGLSKPASLSRTSTEPSSSRMSRRR